MVPKVLVGILSKKPIVKKIKVPGQGKRAQTREVRYFKIIDRGGKTDEVLGDGLLTISRTTFIDGQANVFSLYQQRVRRMQLFAPKSKNIRHTSAPQRASGSRARNLVL